MSLLAATLTACAPGTPEGVPGRYYVLPPGRAIEAASLGTWPDKAPSPEGAWTLTEKVVQDAERALPGMLPVPADEYHRQYAGVVAGGRRWVFIHARLMPFVSPDAESMLVRHVHGPHEGPATAWGALFDPALGAFRYTSASRPPGTLGGLPTLAAHGATTFSQLCTSCHIVEKWQEPEPEHDAHGPSLRDWAGTVRPLTRGGSVVADERYFRGSVLDASAAVSEGYRAVMPSFSGMLSDGAITAMWAYVACLSDETATRGCVGVCRRAGP